MRRLLLLVCSVVCVETIFFAALAPLLPHYADELDLSKTGAGLLTAAYAIGGIAAAIPAGLLAVRLGVKATVLIGMALMSAASVAFGFAESEWMLDVTRAGQGAGAAVSWTGGLAWLVAASPRERRGELLGVAMGCAVAGALLGPLLGGIAVVVGPEPAFSGIAVLGLAVAAWAWMTPALPPSGRQPLRALFAAVPRPQVAGGLWLLTLPALLFGVLAVLAPLRLDELGFGAVAIGAVWLVAAGLEAIASPFLGRWSDRSGRLAPVRAGLIASIAVSLVLPWIGEGRTLAALVVAAGIAYGVFWVPGMALLSDGIEAAGLDHGLGFGLMNLGWAPGHIVGAAAGGALGDAAGDVVPYFALAGVCLLTLAAIERRASLLPIGRRQEEAVEPG